MYQNKQLAESILIIDDVTANLVVLTEIIKEANLIPRPVTSVKQAMLAIQAALPQLILLDITMPEINGYEYCKMLKKSSQTKDIPVIFISALNTAKDRVKGFECGAVDYISKPFEKAEVLLRVNTHLKLYRMQRELEVFNKKLHTLVNQQLGQISDERRNMIYALAKLSEARDNTSRKHLDNVAKNCRLLAMSLQFTKKYEKVISNDFIDTIELVAPLHDIGKIVIPDKILRKPSKLDEEETKIMQTHTSLGAQILTEIYAQNENNEFIRMAIEIASSHHEKWNGNGYPKALKGTEIPLAARIMAVADAYDTLICERCYKKAMSHEESMSILNEESGKSFDPDIIHIMNKVQKRLRKGTTIPVISDGIENELFFDDDDTAATISGLDGNIDSRR